MIKNWIRSHFKQLLDTPIFSIGQHKAKSQTRDLEGTFYSLQAPDWINVLAVTSDQQVVLVKQYRQGTDEVTLEIPGGAVDKEDSLPLNAAQRELLEETGYKAEKWTSLGCVSVNPAFMTNYCHFYLAEDCTLIQHQDPDPLEEIEVLTVPLSEFLTMVTREEIDHSLIVAAVGRYLLLKQNKS